MRIPLHLVIHENWQRLAAATLFVVLTVLGCGGPTFVVAQYDGPPRPRGTIAILRQVGSDPVQMVSVDGEPLGPVDRDARLHIEVLPGEHSVGIANLAHTDQPAQRVRFRAEPGKLYGAVWTPAGAPRVVELDASTGAALRDVSMMQPSEPPLVPARPVARPPPAAPPPPPAPAADAAPEPAPLPAADAAPQRTSPQ